MKKLLNAGIASIAGAVAALAYTPPTHGKSAAPAAKPKAKGKTGVERAAARLKAHRAIWANTPTTTKVSRQVRRRLARKGQVV